MRHRHWLLPAAGIPLLYSFVFIRINAAWYPTYGETDIWAGTILAAALLLAWAALEIASRLINTRQLRCACGYPLGGLQCPECGHAIGGERQV